MVAEPIKLPNEEGRSYDGNMLDITGAGDVEVSLSPQRGRLVLHVNVDGVCVLRICRITGRVVRTGGIK